MEKAEALEIVQEKYPSAGAEEVRILAKPVERLLVQFRKACMPAKKDIAKALKTGEGKLKDEMSLSAKKISKLKTKRSEEVDLDKAYIVFKKKHGEEPTVGTKEYQIYKFKLLNYLQKQMAKDEHPDYDEEELKIYVKPLVDLYWGSNDQPEQKDIKNAIITGESRVREYRSQQ